MRPGANEVILADGRRLEYDQLVIATGVEPRPDQTPGMLDGGYWRERIFDYTYDGAVALAEALRRFDGGRLVVHIVDMPIKCPVAPLEFAFLADAHFRRLGARDRVELVYATPLPGRSPSRSRRPGSPPCWTIAGSPWRPTSWWSASTAPAWCPTTSARFRSTCS